HARIKHKQTIPSLRRLHDIGLVLDNRSIRCLQTRGFLSLSRGFSSMRKHYVSFLSLLFAGFIFVGGRAFLKAQQASSSAVKGGRWSDAATWADKKVPAAGAVVTIDKGMDVVLDVSPPPLHGLTINGKLSFADNKDLELTTEWVMLHGELEIG